MLKYGEIQNVQNGYSRNTKARNLTYRTSDNANNISVQSASGTLALSGGGTGGGGGGNTDNITATTGDFVNLNANTLNADIIKKKNIYKFSNFN